MPDIFSNQTTPPQSPSTSSGQNADLSTPGTIEKVDNPETIVPLPGNLNPISMFTAFSLHPIGVTFDTQEAGEQILLFLRKHFITNVAWIFTSIILLLIPPLLATAQPIFEPFKDSFPPNTVTVITILYYLLTFAYIFANFITWFYNISLVTTIRVVDIDFSQLVFKNVAATKLTLVQDVSFSQIGVIPSLFNYGNVLVQTAGAIDNLDFMSVPEPQRVVEIIEDLIGKRSNV